MACHGDGVEQPYLRINIDVEAVDILHRLQVILHKSVDIFDLTHTRFLKEIHHAACGVGGEIEPFLGLDHLISTAVVAECGETT